MQLAMKLELKPDPRIKERVRNCRFLGGTFDVAEWEDKDK